MFTAPHLISYRVPDLAAAKQWYRTALGAAPVFEAPFAAVFQLGGCGLMLLPLEDPAAGGERSVAFWEVADIEAAYRQLLEAGATARSEITFTLMRTRVAKMADPFGNVLGIMSSAEKPKTVEERPSESAMTVAFSRALAAHDDREGMRGPDHLAEVFLNEEGRKPLADRTGREWIIGKMTGSHEYFLARTRYIDGVVSEALRAGVPQLVLLGAGYDSRAARFRELVKDTRIFELDVAATQRRKRERLEQAALAVPPQLTYVTINFEKESIPEALARAGHDRGRETLFVWEGVSYYLTAQAVDDTLAALRDCAPPGSTLCFDYMLKAPDILERHGVKEVFEAWRQAYSGEPVRFGIAEGTIEAFLAGRGYRLLEHLLPADQEQRLLGGVAKVVALFGLARARISA